MTTEEDECRVCRGERVVETRSCVPGCRPWRHRAECPVKVKVPCAMCETRELGEDLNA